MRGLLLIERAEMDSDETHVVLYAMRRAGLTVDDDDSHTAKFDELTAQSADLVVAIVSHEGAFKLLKQLRDESPLPIVLVMDPVSEQEHVALLAAGADLVVYRPYSTTLLIEQMRVLMRRATSVPLTTLSALVEDGLRLDPDTRTLQIQHGRPQQLTNLEFRLLYALMTHRNQTLSYESLIEEVWGYNGEGEFDLIRNLISRLRAKVEVDPREPAHIFTVPNVGYVFR